MHKLRSQLPGQISVNRNVKGFTLIELMIVVGIVGILAAIAYPSYQQQMRETRRTDAYSALSRIADLQERYYLQNRTYTTDITQLGGSTSEEGYYTLSVTAADNNTYTLQAAAVAGGPQENDTGCTIINLNQAGTRTPANCWK